jgi:hypothetical protein
MTIESSKSKPYRVIHTARHLEAINSAVDEGFFPLIRQLKPSHKLYATYCVFRNRKTNKVETAEAEKGYVQYGKEYSYSRDEWDMVISNAQYYPYQFLSPFAAYLIPPDIAIGERVVIEDLIEDYYGGTFWSHNIRLETLEAIWDGSDLVIQYDPNVDGVCNWVG